MNMTVAKWGNSLGIRIPAGIAQQAGIGLGAALRVTAKKGRIILEPAQDDLATLIGGITPGNRHDSVETGSAIGHEIW